MGFEFSWMTYFVSLFALASVSLALTWLCPPADPTNDKPGDPSTTADAAGERKSAAR